MREQIIGFFRARGGQAPLSELYAHMAGQAVSRTVRETSTAFERLVARGELVEEEAGQYRYLGRSGHNTKPSPLHEKLWRALHVRTERSGGATSADLAMLARCDRSSAAAWLRQMAAEGRAAKLPGQGPACYRLNKNQPGPDFPPAFKWARRGKAKTKAQIEKGS
ncbi:MAG: hypothetical protein PVG60_01820 [Desulfarculaceae bacterium]|jgi:hypothetical protein